MEACGIIVEYNPFHNGHRYHVLQASKLSGADVVVAVMSGNFLQRGEPAIMDKWVRANEALDNGVDIVIELPFAWAVQSADYFARGAVKLLQGIGCKSLCFGTDVSETVDYEKFGRFVVANNQLIKEKYKELNKARVSYPQQMTAVFQELYPEMMLDFSSPNHILGLSYGKENAVYQTPMKLYPLKREQSAYHETTIHQQFASATAIRKKVLENELSELEQVLPKETYQDLSEYPLAHWELYWPYLRYKLNSSSYDELRALYQVTEGIEYRLKEASLKATSFGEFVAIVKTKRYTWARIQRLATYILHNVKKEEIQLVWEKSYLRLLGFSEKGQKYLKEQKKKVDLPIISRISKENKSFLDLDIRSGQIYQLGKETITEQNFGRFPIKSLER
ncbi:nucleotidyltransferase [Enterococcus rivorum]|uniref:tRNA(Met) cytidine acetate ligase n=1 Tax=Enterococcus rivorum TaxID=762845 RepID=A0A1E5KSD9_9ENTE|nr:nucleotidyltransferase [Enterococcus rivorum]MBP2098270.1 putative nucleotidyltransferase [Enterococcus rivorum]OEH80812.1 hypothetical protein BCR26_06160 [Enterococcus rivorum]